MFVHVSAIFGLCGIMWRILCSLLAFRPILEFFWHILPQLMNFSKNLSADIIQVLDANLVPKMMFDLAHLGREISFVEKTVTHTLTHPSYFDIHEPQCTELRDHSHCNNNQKKKYKFSALKT